MVRKRSHKKYISIESDETDSDEYYLETPPEESRSKKYSLRKRKSTNFVENLDNEDEDNEDAILNLVEEEISIPKSKKPCDSSEFSNITQKQRSSTPNCTITKLKGRELEPTLSNETLSFDNMIDFEDVIRADILVNNSRIDYDSVIEKTEIKIANSSSEMVKDKCEQSQQIDKSSKLKKNDGPPKKRTSKSRKIIKNDSYEFFEPESTGLPINSVLGVTESLFELAQRYQIEKGLIDAGNSLLDINEIG